MRSLVAHFDAVAGVKSGVFNVSGFDLLEVVSHGYQTTIRPFTGDLDDVGLAGSAAGRQNGLQQSNALNEGLLTRKVDYSVELLLAAELSSRTSSTSPTPTR